MPPGHSSTIKTLKPRHSANQTNFFPCRNPTVQQLLMVSTSNMSEYLISCYWFLNPPGGDRMGSVGIVAPSIRFGFSRNMLCEQATPLDDVLDTPDEGDGGGNSCFSCQHNTTPHLCIQANS
jgi:hypothetical protein